MEAFLAFASEHWMEWLCTAIVALVGLGHRSLSKKLKEEKEQNKAIAEGVQSLLRESIVSNYNKYLDKGYCPIYAKESIKKVYKAYHDLGGNDVATTLYEKLLKMEEDHQVADLHRVTRNDDDGK